MKPDVMERLLIDHALGRLDPDVNALLADHLANDAASAAQARELHDVVHLATEAVRQPALAVKAPHQIHRLVWRHRAEQVLALAASFAIGAGITAAAFRANLRHDDSTVSLAPSIQNAPPRLPRQNPLVQGRIEALPFWSNQRLYVLAQASAAGANTKEMLK
jgi:hypothetical protein